MTTVAATATATAAATSSASGRIAAALVAGAASVILVVLLVPGVESFGATQIALAAVSFVSVVASARGARLSTGILWIVSAAGASGALALGADDQRLAMTIGIAGIGFLAAAGIAREFSSSLTGAVIPRAGIALLALGLLVRLLPQLQGDLLNGQLELFGESVQIGEFTRILVVAGAALLIWDMSAAAGANGRGALAQRAYAVGGALLLANLALLVVVDTGPAVIVLVATLATTGTAARIMGVRLARWGLVLAAVGVVTALVATASQLGASARLAERFGNILEPDFQLGVGLASMQEAGVVGLGFGSTPLSQHIVLPATDFFPAYFAAGVGLAGLGIVAAALFFALGRMAIAVSRRSSAAAMAGWALLIAIGVQAFATLAGVLGAIPLTGLSTPGLTVNGSTALALMIVAGVANGIISAARGTGELLPGWKPRFVQIAATASIWASCLVLAMVPSTARSFSALLPRGDVLSRDGVVLASTNASGDREYPEGAVYGELGWSVPGYTANGVEASGADILTCGAAPDWTEVLAQALHPAPCRPADLVTTLDSALQQAAYSAVAGADAQVTVLDSWSGEVMALVSSDSLDPGSVDRDTVNDPATMRNGTPPGSTFKVLDAVVALSLGTDSSGAPGDILPVAAGSIRNSGGFTCPDPSISTMLRVSCNTTAAYLALQAGQVAFGMTASAYFAIDHAPSFDGGPADPIMTGLAGPEMNSGQLARTAIGQESARATVLSVAWMTGLVARAADPSFTAPQALTPHVIAGGCDAGAFTPAVPDELFEDHVLPIPTAIAQQVVSAMHDAVALGTAQRLAGSDRDLAAKTGTAEIGGTGVKDRWVTVIVDARWIVTVVVHGATAGTEALDVALDVIPFVPTESVLPDCEGPDL